MKTSGMLPEECKAEIRARIAELDEQTDFLMATGDGHSAHHMTLRIAELRRVLGEGS